MDIGNIVFGPGQKMDEGHQRVLESAAKGQTVTQSEYFSAKIAQLEDRIAVLERQSQEDR